MGVQSLGREEPLEEGMATHCGTTHMAVFFPGEAHGQRSVAGCSPCGDKKLDMTEQLTHIHTQREVVKGSEVASS